MKEQTRNTDIDFVADNLPNPSLVTKPAKTVDMVSISFQEIVRRMISNVGDRGTPDYRREWQEIFRPRRVDML